jgi:hypothetical protein
MIAPVSLRAFALIYFPEITLLEFRGFLKFLHDRFFGIRICAYLGTQAGVIVLS